jgi:hypothetical protein
VATRGPKNLFCAKRSVRRLLSAAQPAGPAFAARQPAGASAAPCWPSDGDRTAVRAFRQNKTSPTPATENPSNSLASDPLLSLARSLAAGKSRAPRRSVRRRPRLAGDGDPCRGGGCEEPEPRRPSRRRPTTDDGGSSRRRGGAHPSPSLFLYRARGGGWSELPAASGLCGACTGDAPQQWTAARPSAPEGGLSLSAVVEASSSTARVLRPVLWLTDTHRDREERARPEMAAHYSGEPEASPVRFYSPFLS